MCIRDRASISFYGIIAYNDVRKSLKHHRKHELSYGFVAYFKDLRDLIIEFGPSEILDVLAVRPFFMYLIPKIIGEFVLGTFIGKGAVPVVSRIRPPILLVKSIGWKYFRSFAFEKCVGLFLLHLAACLIMNV